MVPQKLRCSRVSLVKYVYPDEHRFPAFEVTKVNPPYQERMAAK